MTGIIFASTQADGPSEFDDPRAPLPGDKAFIVIGERGRGAAPQSPTLEPG
jgi:hypothetical protein